MCMHICMLKDSYVYVWASKLHGSAHDVCMLLLKVCPTTRAGPVQLEMFNGPCNCHWLLLNNTQNVLSYDDLSC